MRAAILALGATMLLAPSAWAKTPTGADTDAVLDAKTQAQLRKLLAELAPPSAVEPEHVSQSKLQASQSVQNSARPGFAPDQPMPVGTMVLMCAMLCAVGVIAVASKRRGLASRPLKRLAAESLGARQHIVLVEALGEYLLVATGGREPVLLAQLDTEQAKARLAAMKDKKTVSSHKSVFAQLSNAWRRPSSKGLTQEPSAQSVASFENVLEATPPRIEPTASKDVSSMQAALQYIAHSHDQSTPTTRAPRHPQTPSIPARPRTNPNTKLVELARARTTSSPSSPLAAPNDSDRTNAARESRNEEIRRRLAAL